jgi:hypothetical protein
MKIITGVMSGVLAVSAMTAIAPAAQAQAGSPSLSVSSNGSSIASLNDVTLAAASSQKWSAWYKLKDSTGKKFSCRNYVSVNSGSRIKYRAYTECTRKVYMTSFVAGSGGGHSRACVGKWCDAVKYVKNKKGSQKWCAGATAAILGKGSPDKYDVRTCIRY